MDVSDWLLPQPTTTVPTAGLWNADGSFSDGALVEVLNMAADELSVSLHAFADDGSPAIPPERHILDHLCRAWDLVDEDTQIDHPFAANTVHVATGPLPECAFCDEPARYDGHVVTLRGDARASMCVDHARKVVDQLGSPSGNYYLMQADEVPVGVRDRVNSRLHELGRERLFDEG